MQAWNNIPDNFIDLINEYLYTWAAEPMEIYYIKVPLGWEDSKGNPVVHRMYYN